MDNLKYMNSALAYDFEMFMPREKTMPRENIVKMPKSRVKTAPKRKAVALQAVSSKLLAAVVTVFMLAAFCFNIYMRIAINEINSEINDVKSQINELDSEYTRLSVEFNRKISYQNLEEEAANLGMRKMDKNQVVYIRVNDTNTAQNTRSGNLAE